jgi:hypothetical protein
MTILIIVIIVIILLVLFIPGSYVLDDYLYGLYSADAQSNAAAYWADSITPRVATTYEEGAFDGILPSGKRI